MSSSVKLGQYAEQLAEQYLKNHGLSLVNRNFRQRGGEIDLIMQDGTSLVFIEVRYRQSDRFGGALVSINQEKQRKVIQTAQYFLQHYSGSYEACRFDAIAIDAITTSDHIQWVKDAFRLN